MVRIRTAWFVAAVAALALGGACKKNDDAKKTDDKSAPKTTDLPAGGTPATPVAAIAASATRTRATCRSFPRTPRW